MLKKHYDGVVRWFTSNLNNGLIEGFNSLFQAAKRKERRYRSDKNMIAMVCLLALVSLTLIQNHIKEWAIAWSHASLVPERIPLSSYQYTHLLQLLFNNCWKQGVKHLYQFPCPIFIDFMGIGRVHLRQKLLITIILYSDYSFL
ncbi:transposase [Marinicrinis sediminis]|uniref:Transposase n=1 Tax=Marinicrinis sediminis TaxID=1652465 RepID=A0ABW5R5W9_9BACL